MNLDSEEISEETMAKRQVLKIDNANDFTHILRTWWSPENNDSDRAFALVGATIVENCLESYLKSEMLDKKLPKGRSVFLDLFDGEGPLNRFSAKNSVAFATRLIGPMVYNDLESIRQIRNKFAHTVFSSKTIELPLMLTFDSPEVSVWIDKLTPESKRGEITGIPTDPPAKTNKDKFSVAVSDTALILWANTITKSDAERKSVLA